MKILILLTLLLACTLQQVVPIQIRVAFDYKLSPALTSDKTSIVIKWNDGIVWSGNADAQQHHKEITFKAVNGDNLCRF